MSLSVAAIIAQVTSHAKKLGIFRQVSTHEPKSAPKNGLTASFWLSRVEPVAAASGLSTSSARVEIECRIYAPMLSEPQDAIDLKLLETADKLMAAYSSDFTLGGEVMDVDLLGRYGTALSAETGYIETDRINYRVIVITLPLIIADLWNQAP